VNSNTTGTTDRPSLKVPSTGGPPPSRLDRTALRIVREIGKRPRLAQAILSPTRWGNQFTEENLANPYPMHQVIRADGPVVWNPWYQQWFVTGYDEAQEVLSSSATTVAAQRDLVLACPPHVDMSDASAELIRHFLLLVDPPVHTRLRRLVSGAFTPRQIRRIEESAAQMAAELLDGLADQDEIDMFAAFNAPFPINVIAELLGIPREHWGFTTELSLALTAFLDPFPEFDPPDIDATLQEGIEFFDSLIDARRDEPGDDLLSALLHAEADDDRLDRFETIAVAMFLMFAGHETTSGLLGNAMLALAGFPDQRAMIRADPSLWPNAVEELLRFDTALQIDPRAAAEDFTVGGRRIKAGQNIIVMLGAANRDPRRYDDPDELRLDRVDPRPISFGHGIHFCIGASLARMEIRVGLSAFVERFGDYTIDRDAMEWKNHMVLRGPVKVPLTRGRGGAAPPAS